MLAEQDSSGAMRSTSTVSPLLSGETIFAAMHLARKGICSWFSRSNTIPSRVLRARKRRRALHCGSDLPESDLSWAFSFWPPMLPACSGSQTHRVDDHFPVMLPPEPKPGQAEVIMGQRSVRASPDNSRASTATDWPPLPGHAAAAPSGSGRSWHRPIRRYGSGS
jgi:hypothetical protein